MAFYTTPIISCIIPTFNRSDKLKDAIESTLNQSYTSWELIIVDDDSLDSTMDVVKSYIEKDPRIRYFKNPGKGGSSARNFGAKRAIGEFIAFLDDDDVSLSHRFESQLSAARKSGSDFLVSGYEVKDRKNEKVQVKVKLELKGMGAGFPSRWFIKKELFDKAGGFDEDFPSMQDIELSYRLAGHEKFILHDDIVSIIYHTDNSVSKSKENAIKGKVMLMQRLENRMSAVEAAWWYFIIGLDFYSLGDLSNSKLYIRKAGLHCNRFIYRFGYFYSCIMFPLGGFVKKVNYKILLGISNFRFPVLVNHSIVK